MKKIIPFILLLTLVVSCTKEVPESEKKLVKSTSEKEIKDVLESFVASFNSGEFDKIPSYFTDDFGAFIPDSDSAINLEEYKNELNKLRKRYPEVKLQVNVEGVYVSEDLAAAQTFSSYLANDPVEGKMSPVYSERSIKLLRKTKNDGWKIFKSLSIPAFSY